MIVKVSILVAASVAAFAVAQVRRDSARKPKPSIKPLDEEHIPSFQHQAEEDEDKKVNNSTFVEAEKEKNKREYNLKPKFDKEMIFNVNETELIAKLVTELEQKKVSVETKLLLLYGLQERQSSIAHLHKHLRAKEAEIRMLNFTISSLQDERKELEEKFKEGAMAKKQLEMAEKELKEMQKNMLVRTNKTRGHLTMIEEKVHCFQGRESSLKDNLAVKKLNSRMVLALEVVEMKRRNKELELEKRVLKMQLDDVKARMENFSNFAEAKILAEIKKEIGSLRHVNEDLLQQVERLQTNRFEMIEEIVYQRWLDACLRFEIQNSQTRSKSSLRKELGRNSQEMIDAPKVSSSFDTYSHTSSAETRSGETDLDGMSIDSSISSQGMSKKSSIIHRIKRWGKLKDKKNVSLQSPIKTNLVRRFSMSAVPFNVSTTKDKEFSPMKSAQEPTIYKPQRRVSFNDAVQFSAPTLQDNQQTTVKQHNRTTEKTIDEPCVNSESEKSRVMILRNDALEEECSSSSSSEGIENEQREEVQSSMTDATPHGRQVSSQELHFVAAFSFFFLTLIVLYLSLRAGFF
ncbi:hypothetical protein RJ641_014782 [Dillenia turbinata]|uniref:Protein CHUP1, chloroplastic n=1 Tax=Dillenia turbinata TaxID=194707 RepID=A0AAN8YZP4_9MAGN